MRTALIADIHGNFGGLLAVIADIGFQQCDRVVCLGDLVNGGEENIAVVRYIRENRIPCMMGNHEEINNAQLPPDLCMFMASLPEDIIEGDVIFTHISPRPKRQKINSAVEAWNVFDETRYRLAFVGHTHYPVIFGEKTPEPVSATEYPFEYGVPFRLASDDRYIIVVAPVGYSRDGCDKPRYAIYDNRCGTVEMRAVPGPLLSIDYATTNE